MNKIRVPYRPRPLQKQLFKDRKRWNVNVCHRRFGKTVYELNAMIRLALECPLERPQYAYISPYLKQSKAIAWDYLLHYTAPIPGRKVNQSELRVDLPNGARIRLYGADNPDALRGIYLDGVVMDEYAQIQPSLFPEVIRPALSDRKGWADFTGTPKGQNHFYDLYLRALSQPDWKVSIFRASETGIVDPDELRAAQAMMSEDEYLQEFECSWTAAIKGSYYGDLLAMSLKQGRIGNVPVAHSVPVNTFFDLGMNDTTAIWFHQQTAPSEHRFIDYYENSGEDLAHYARVLQNKGYLYGEHYFPHDVKVKELTSGMSRLQKLHELGITNTVVVPRVDNINEGIEMTRSILPFCHFDKESCEFGLRALQEYQKAWDDKMQVFRTKPLHNWASNGADAFRQFAQGYHGANPASKGSSRRRRRGRGYMVA